ATEVRGRLPRLYSFTPLVLRLRRAAQAGVTLRVYHKQVRSPRASINRGPVFAEPLQRAGQCVRIARKLHSPGVGQVTPRPPQQRHAGPQQYIQKAPQRKLNGNIGELKWEQAQPQKFADEARISLIEEALDVGILRVQSIAEQVCDFLSISSFLEGR